MKIQKFKDWNDKLQLAAKILAALTVLTPAVFTGIKKAKPYGEFVIKGPQLVQNVAELKRAVLVATAATAANMETLDSTIYNIEWKDHIYKGILSKSESGIIYVSVRDGEIGERLFAAFYDDKWYQWYFIDFDGNRINLIK